MRKVYDFNTQDSFLRKWLVFTPITTVGHAKAWLETLSIMGLAFHLEDDPKDQGGVATDRGKWVRFFTDDEAAAIRSRIKETYSMSWEDYGGPLGYLLYIGEVFMRDQTHAE